MWYMNNSKCWECCLSQSELCGDVIWLLLFEFYEHCMACKFEGLKYIKGKYFVYVW